MSYKEPLLLVDFGASVDKRGSVSTVTCRNNLDPNGAGFGRSAKKTHVACLGHTPR